jgi:hypothetical protein
MTSATAEEDCHEWRKNFLPGYQGAEEVLPLLLRAGAMCHGDDADLLHAPQGHAQTQEGTGDSPGLSGDGKMKTSQIAGLAVMFMGLITAVACAFYAKPIPWWYGSLWASNTVIATYIALVRGDK